jgi:hypothetical protein
MKLMGKKSGDKGRLAEKEKEREEFQAALAKALREAKKLFRAVSEAEKVRDVAKAAAVTGGPAESREARRREEIVSGLKEGLAKARGEADTRQAALDRCVDEIAELEATLAGPRAAATRKQAIELAVLLRQRQEELLETAKQLVALHKVTAKATPKRLVSRRATRFLQVEITEPTLVEQMRPRLDTRPSSVLIHVEYFRALRGVKEGKWQVVNGQDMVLRPEEIEEQWDDGKMPPEVEKIRDLNLGELFPVNGKPRTKLEKELMDFGVIEDLVSDEDMAQMVARIEEGA